MNAGLDQKRNERSYTLATIAKMDRARRARSTIKMFALQERPGGINFVEKPKGRRGSALYP